MDYHRIKFIFGIILLLFALSACDRQQVSISNSERPQSSSKDIATTGQTKILPAAQVLSIDLPASLENNGMKKSCQQVTFSLVINAAEAGAQRTTTLWLTDARGLRAVIDRPAEMQDYTAVALACATSADGKAFFVVQYGELDEGCAFCEWFYLYDAAGKQLTKSVPPILEDKSLPPAQQQYPNNQEYEAMLKQLGLTHPEMDYLP